MIDTISRQAMLDGIDKLIKIHFDRTVVLHKARQVAENLPSVQPEQQWIPVEERLPEPWSLVLVTDTCKNVSMCQMSWGNKNWYDEGENWMYFPDSVIAWMPLPEYYREESEQE